MFIVKNGQKKNQDQKLKYFSSSEKSFWVVDFTTYVTILSKAYSFSHDCTTVQWKKN